MPTIVKIYSFNPLNVEAPEKIITPVKIYLPKLRVILMKLDMDGIIPGMPRLQSEVEMLTVDIGNDSDIPTEIEYGKFMQFIHDALDYFKQVHKIAQDELDKKEFLK